MLIFWKVLGAISLFNLLKSNQNDSNLNYEIEELKEKAYAIVGNPQPIQYGDKIVALIEYRDGSLIDVVRNV